MIRVVSCAGGYRWTMIDGTGRTLVISRRIYHTDHRANAVAVRYRRLFWRAAARRDHLRY